MNMSCHVVFPEACKLQEPGGKCVGVPTGAGDCTMAKLVRKLSNRNSSPNSTA